MGIGTPVAPGRSHQIPGTRNRDPFLGGQKETVSPGIISNSLESGGIKTGIIDLLPHTKEQHSVLIFQPLLDKRTFKNGWSPDFFKIFFAIPEFL